MKYWVLTLLLPGQGTNYHELGWKRNLDKYAITQHLITTGYLTNVNANFVIVNSIEMTVEEFNKYYGL